MDFKNVADHLRDNTMPLSVAEIVVISGQGDFTGNGKLWNNGDQLELEITLAGDQGLPSVGGVMTREQFWKIGGVIEGQVPFWGVSVPDQHQVHQARFTVRSGCFSFDRIHHLTRPFDDGALRDAVLEAAEAANPENSTLARGYVDARLTDYEILWCELMTTEVEQNPFLGDKTRTKRDTFIGELGDFEYALIQRGSDCELHLRLKQGASAPAEEVRRVSGALYCALAFVHGRHTWPQWERIDFGTDSTLEYATAPQILSENIHTPITKRTCANGSDATLLIRKAVECFLRENDFSRALDNYLFLTREAAAKETPVHVGALGLCAVFEGLVALLYDNFCATNSGPTPDEFKQAKSSLVDYAKGRRATDDVKSGNSNPWERLIGLLESAHPLRPADKYLRLIEHFRLPGEKMAPAIKAWKKHRHPLAHGVPNDDSIEQMIARSRIAGAINVLAAAALGYSGLMVISRIDDSYIRLP